MNLAETPELYKHPQYEQIKRIVAELNAQNLLRNGAGFCYAMSDLIYHRLAANGIRSTIIEVELTAICSDPPSFFVVGHKEGVNISGDPANPGRIVTHVVVLVEHDEYPLLIDTSISHYLPHPFTWVCGFADRDNSVGDFRRNNWHLTYRQKTGDQFPAIHQKSIVDRMQLDRKIEKVIAEFRYIKKLAIGLFVFVLLMSGYNFYVVDKIGTQQQINIEHLKSLDDKHQDVIERVRAYRDQLMNLQSNVITKK